VKKITIGMCVYDDYDGVYFTLQSIRLNHPEILDRVEFIILNNNPTSLQGMEIPKLIRQTKEPITYLEFTKYNSPFLKSKIFDLADTDYVLVVDCHVLIEPGALKRLLDFYDAGKDDGNLLQGPLLYDDLKNISTHFDLSEWSTDMWGTWSTDKRGLNKNNEPFEIPAQGMGVFTCRKDSWLGFNKKFRGFGGEEGYIHCKYRRAGKKTLCLPFLRWLHRFNRPEGAKFTPSLEDRFRNYMIGFQEIGRDTSEIIERFEDRLSTEIISNVKKELKII
tara:strand:+ start:443 stop:1273 length:831 start_codon:yes stop_codon:yes gene_type:complete